MNSPACWILALLVLSACGGTPPRVYDVTPFTAEHEPMFENGLDMVRDPEALGDGGGTWLGTWEQELDQRVSLADVVALVTIRTLRTDTDLDRRNTFRLVAHPDRVFLGADSVQGEELLLSVAEGQGGYGTVANNERRLLDQQFFVFLKWQRNDVDEVLPRWHLSPATEAVALRVRDLLSRRRQVAQDNQGRRRVIVHEN